jgi:hypothetical protein
MFPLKKVIPFYCKSRIKCFCEKGFSKKEKEFSLQNRNKKLFISKPKVPIILSLNDIIASFSL